MLGPVQFRILDETITYTGTELRPHWGLEQTGVYGSLLTAFVGPCRVPTGHLVDMEDRLASDHIESKAMLHVLGEFYGTSLEAGVLYQRLFMNWAQTLLNEYPKSANKGGDWVVARRGDDLFVGDRKLSVSIATVSPVSVLVHWGLNVDPTGAPVKAIGFQELGWSNSEVLAFAKKLITHYIGELEEIRVAQCKVRPVTN
jgi:hypothetical protein